MAEKKYRVPTGMIPAMLTPFNENDELNVPVIEQLTERFIEAGVDGIFCLGTNGEFFAMSADEKVKLIEIVMKKANGRIPIYAGTGGITTKDTIELSLKMKELGVDALSVITPYFLPFTQEEVKQHYIALAEAVDLPIILYNIPGRTGVNLEPETVAELAKIPNIVGIKDSSGDFDLIKEYIRVTDDEFSVMAGNDSFILDTLIAGGKGAVAATSNVGPEWIAKLYANWKEGNIEEARVWQEKLNGLRGILNLGTLPSVFKACLQILGIPVGEPRKPVLPVSAESRKKIEEVLNELIKEETRS